MRLMLDKPDLRAIPRNPRSFGGQAGNEARQPDAEEQHNRRFVFATSVITQGGEGASERGINGS
jgi:hypothetical protein